MNDPIKNVNTEHVFHFEDGKKAHNLKDLRDCIDGMTQSSFSAHVDDANNDFANWVEFVYKKKAVAEDLRKVSSPKESVEILDAELGKYGLPGLEDVPVPDEEKPKPKTAMDRVTKPPQSITHNGTTLHTVSTEDTHKFIVKEFIWGLVAGLLAGILLFASMLYFGIFPGL